MIMRFLFIRLSFYDLRFEKVLSVFSNLSNAKKITLAYSDEGLNSDSKATYVYCSRIGFSPIKRVTVYLVKFFYTLVIELKKKYDFIYASDFEAAICIFLLSKFISVNYIYDIHDEINLRYNIHGLNYLLRKLDYLIKLNARYIIVCDEVRYLLIEAQFRSKTHIINNKPLRLTIKKTCEPSLCDPKIMHWIAEKKSTGHTVLLLSGWLVDRRGFTKIINFVEKNKDKYCLILAGFLNEAGLAAVGNQESKLYVGNLEQLELLKLFKLIDYQFCLYDPQYDINLYASPNKYWDSFFMNTKFLTNYEILSSRNSEFERLVVYIDYYNVANWANVLDEINPKVEIKVSKNPTFFDDETYNFYCIIK